MEICEYCNGVGGGHTRTCSRPRCTCPTWVDAADYDGLTDYYEACSRCPVHGNKVETGKNLVDLNVEVTLQIKATNLPDEGLTLDQIRVLFVSGLIELLEDEADDCITFSVVAIDGVPQDQTSEA